MEPCVVQRRSLWAAGAITSALTTAVDQQPYVLLPSKRRSVLLKGEALRTSLSPLLIAM